MQRRAVFDALCGLTKPEQLMDLYVFSCGPSTFKNSNPKLRLLKEYYRLLGKGSINISSTAVEDGSLSVSNVLWRVTSINYNYTLCSTYPFAVIVPKSIRYFVILRKCIISSNFFEIFMSVIVCA